MKKRRTFNPLKWLLLWILRLIWKSIVHAWQLNAPCEAPSEEAIHLFYKSPAWQHLARSVKDERRRTFGGLRCECCGIKSTEARIVTDHIKSIRRYWHLRLSRSNLQNLCDVCNRHKGSHIEADFRRLARLA